MCVCFTPVRIVDVERVLHALLGGVDGVGSAGLGQRGRLPRRVLCHQALLKASEHHNIPSFWLWSRTLLYTPHCTVFVQCIRIQIRNKTSRFTTLLLLFTSVANPIILLPILIANTFDPKCYTFYCIRAVTVDWEARCSVSHWKTLRVE